MGFQYYWYGLRSYIGIILIHVASFFSDERHTIAMGWVVHKYLHETVGTRYETGLVISGYTT